MTKPEFVRLCKFATERTQFLAQLRSLRAWMGTTGWDLLAAKRVNIHITCVAFEFHSMKKMSQNGIRIALRMYRDGRVELKYRRSTIPLHSGGPDGERWGHWYPLDSDERLYTLLEENLKKVVKHFARSPHLGGVAEWHGHTRTWQVTVKPP
jgi:hypothetical protein